jgi:ABC-type uncharacterized transport system YnjBCD ATPase subunit
MGDALDALHSQTVALTSARSWLRWLYWSDGLGPAIETALAFLLEAGHIRAVDVHVYARSLEDAVDSLLTRSRAESELARLTADAAQLQTLASAVEEARRAAHAPVELACSSAAAMAAGAVGGGAGRAGRGLWVAARYTRGAASVSIPQLELPPSGVFAIAGRNGVGKSTLLSLIVACADGVMPVGLQLMQRTAAAGAAEAPAAAAAAALGDSSHEAGRGGAEAAAAVVVLPARARVANSRPLTDGLAADTSSAAAVAPSAAAVPMAGGHGGGMGYATLPAAATTAYGSEAALSVPYHLSRSLAQGSHARLGQLAAAAASVREWLSRETGLVAATSAPALAGGGADGGGRDDAAVSAECSSSQAQPLALAAETQEQQQQQRQQQQRRSISEGGDVVEIAQQIYCPLSTSPLDWFRSGQPSFQTAPEPSPSAARAERARSPPGAPATEGGGKGGGPWQEAEQASGAEPLSDGALAVRVARLAVDLGLQLEALIPPDTSTPTPTAKATTAAAATAAAAASAAAAGTGSAASAATSDTEAAGIGSPADATAAGQRVAVTAAIELALARSGGDGGLALAAHLAREHPDLCATLSGGQRVKVELIRAVFARDACPPVLLVDEALAPLDGASRQAVQRKLGAFCANSLMLIVHHADTAPERGAGGDADGGGAGAGREGREASEESRSEEAVGTSAASAQKQIEAAEEEAAGTAGARPHAHGEQLAPDLDSAAQLCAQLASTFFDGVVAFRQAEDEPAVTVVTRLC